VQHTHRDNLKIGRYGQRRRSDLFAPWEKTGRGGDASGRQYFGCEAERTLTA
jgi:hypothetical protein